MTIARSISWWREVDDGERNHLRPVSRQLRASGEKRQRKLCRSYLREVGLTEVGFVAEYGHPGPGLSNGINSAGSDGATEVVVCDLTHLGRTPWVNLKNSNLLEEAGLTIHVAAGIVSGPVTDDDIRDKMLFFAETGLNTLCGDDLTER